MLQYKWLTPTVFAYNNDTAAAGERWLIWQGGLLPIKGPRFESQSGPSHFALLCLPSTKWVAKWAYLKLGSMKKLHMAFGLVFGYSPYQGDLRLSGPPSGQGVGDGPRTRDRRVPAGSLQISGRAR
ncbi:hypothetical protein PoB_004924800 [Plakobranchus ocellatus]|uniref:Uncharacterized protein n=1 Tax=Plakobranchus ocellatus TaxID=259542 RepID=A0AAV4BU92_9GAST|nr:hypothetical protein PoB_004924800 [Plakobranchus ocellatus]